MTRQHIVELLFFIFVLLLPLTIYSIKEIWGGRVRWIKPNHNDHRHWIDGYDE